MVCFSEIENTIKKDRPRVSGLQERRARLGMREFLYKKVLHRRNLKEDRVLEGSERLFFSYSVLFPFSQMSATRHQTCPRLRQQAFE